MSNSEILELKAQFKEMQEELNQLKDKVKELDEESRTKYEELSDAMMDVCNKLEVNNKLTERTYIMMSDNDKWKGRLIVVLVIALLLVVGVKATELISFL